MLRPTGVGEPGETRLAVQAARDAADLFPDGVAFVALASVDNDSLVVPTVCRVLSLQKRSSKTASPPCASSGPFADDGAGEPKPLTESASGDTK